MMGKNYSVEDILVEIKHKKEQEHPAAASAGRADELVEEILMERETAKKHRREIAQETRMFPGMDKKTPAGVAEGAESVPPAEGEGAPKQALPVPDVRNTLPEKQPEGKRPVYESVKSRNPAGYFTRSFRRVDSGKTDRTENDGEMRLERASRERMQARLQAKVGLTFTQQLSGEPGKSKYGIVGGEQKLAQAQEQNHHVKKAVRQSVTEAFERAAAAGTPIFRDTAPLLFDTKSSLKINLPEKKEEPKQEQEKVPGTPQPVEEENNLQAQAEADGQPFEVSEEVLSMHEELSKKREEKVKKFHLFDTEEPDEEEEEPPAPKQESIEDFESYEDAESVQSDLNYTRFKVVFRLGVVAVLTVLSLYIGLSSRFSLPLPSAVSAAGDPFLFLMINFGLLVIGALVCIGVVGRGLLSLFTFSPDSDSFCAAAVVGAAVQGAIFPCQTGTCLTGGRPAGTCPGSASDFTLQLRGETLYGGPNSPKFPPCVQPVR